MIADYFIKLFLFCCLLVQVGWLFVFNNHNCVFSYFQHSIHSPNSGLYNSFFVCLYNLSPNGVNSLFSDTMLCSGFFSLFIFSLSPFFIYKYMIAIVYKCFYCFNIQLWKKREKPICSFFPYSPIILIVLSF